MALEDLTGVNVFIDDLVATNPTVGTDQKFQGDDHIRGVKNVLKNTFPQLSGAIAATQAELNTLAGITAVVAELNVLDGITAVVGDLNLIAGIAAASGQMLTGDNDGTTKGVFVQAVAPYGWTIDTAFDDRVLTIDSGGGADTGGSGDLTSGSFETSSDGAHTHAGTTGSGSSSGLVGAGAAVPVNVAGHTHGFTTGSDGAHTHTLAPAYAKAIVCTLDTL